MNSSWGAHELDEFWSYVVSDVIKQARAYQAEDYLRLDFRGFFVGAKEL